MTNNSSPSEIFCPQCTEILTLREGKVCKKCSNIQRIWECKKCSNIQRIWKCKNPSIKFQGKICRICDFEKLEHESRKCEESQFKSYIEKCNCCFNKVVLPLLIVCIFLYYLSSANNTNFTKIEEAIEKLKKKYPAQENSTWGYFLSVLDTEIPSIKSITLLHGENKSTADCLTKELVFLKTFNKNLKSDEITFSSSDFETKDFGFALEHYSKVVLKFRVFVTDLAKVNANVARVFHFLCDDTYPDLKPSLFIFTLKYDKNTEHLKPIHRATTILTRAWSDLPQNEISSLLSRVIKNVVVIIPERDRC